MRRSLLLLAMATAILFAPRAFADGSNISPSAPRILVMVRLAPSHQRAGGGYSGGYGDDQARGGRRRLADQVARAHALKLLDSWPMPMLGVDCFVMAVPDARSADAVAQAVSNDAGVVWSQPVNTYVAKEAPPGRGDPLLPMQPAARLWRLAELHTVATGRGVRIAVIDSRIDARHPDLAGQLEMTEDFAPEHPGPQAERHGTAVAGVIAAKANNGLGIAGVAPASRLLGLRACWESQDGAAGTICDSLSLARAIQVAVARKAPVLNLSLAGPKDRLLATLLEAAQSRGAIVVAATDPSLPGGGFPASLPGVIAVSDNPNARTPGVYIAPGRDVPTTLPDGRWGLVDGSSFAAAHVSGLIALLLQHPGLRDAKAALVSARSDGGEINACTTVLKASPPCDPIRPPDRRIASRLQP